MDTSAVGTHITYFLLSLIAARELYGLGYCASAGAKTSAWLFHSCWISFLNLRLGWLTGFGADLIELLYPLLWEKKSSSYLTDLGAPDVLHGSQMLHALLLQLWQHSFIIRHQQHNETTLKNLRIKVMRRDGGSRGVRRRKIKGNRRA